ncbi:MAG TPA: beta-propeller fold lactonase family protein [Acidimicrobiales bacterium]|jgi:6-phosphogluconolactonase (cycloisomerase 2 family)
MPVPIRRVLRSLAVPALVALAVAGVAPSAAGAGEPAGAVYVLTNEAAANAVVAFARAGDGDLAVQGSVPTGGRGTGAGLGSQGALVLNDDGSLLFAVNAGSNTVTTFAVQPDGLRRVGVFPSGGARPISLTVHGDLLYVLNAGAVANVSGLRIGAGGSLTPIAGSRQPLGNPFPNPAQVGFSPDGRLLVVTEKSTQLIDVYRIRSDGRAAPPAIRQSVGIEPFGFAFTPTGHLLVSEAFNGTPGHSAVTSYDPVRMDLAVVSPSVNTHQTAACWVVVTSDGRFAFTTNTGSGTESSFQVGPDGTLALLDPAAGRNGAHSAPIDLDLTDDDAFLYVLNSGSGTVSGFAVSDSGGLAGMAMFGQLPPSSSGLAAR